MPNPYDPAFPVSPDMPMPGLACPIGLTVREYFAIQCFAAMITEYGANDNNAMFAVEHADALIAILNTPNPA